MPARAVVECRAPQRWMVEAFRRKGTAAAVYSIADEGVFVDDGSGRRALRRSEGARRRRLRTAVVPASQGGGSSSQGAYRRPGMDLDDDAFDDDYYDPVADDDSADGDDGRSYDDEDFIRSVAGNAGSYEDLDMEWMNANGAALIERNRNGECAFEYRLDEYPCGSRSKPLDALSSSGRKALLTVRATIISSEAENTQERAADGDGEEDRGGSDGGDEHHDDNAENRANDDDDNDDDDEDEEERRRTTTTTTTMRTLAFQPGTRSRRNGRRRVGDSLVGPPRGQGKERATDVGTWRGELIPNLWFLNGRWTLLIDHVLEFTFAPRIRRMSLSQRFICYNKPDAGVCSYYVLLDYTPNLSDDDDDGAKQPEDFTRAMDNDLHGVMRCFDDASHRDLITAPATAACLATRSRERVSGASYRRERTPRRTFAYHAPTLLSRWASLGTLEQTDGLVVFSGLADGTYTAWFAVEDTGRPLRR